MTVEEQTPAQVATPIVDHGLPVEDPCLSFWQQTTRSFPHLHANRDAPVPAATRYLIIGSGISGALTAFELIHSAGVPGSSITILEAREAASGASSRNAGHVRPDAFRGFQVYQRIHGTEQALRILANERDVLRRLGDFVTRHAVPCDFVPAPTLDVCLTPAFAAFNAASLQAYRDAGGDTSHITVYDDPEAAQRRTGVAGAVSAYEWPAGSSHPAKLVQWLLGQCVDAGARLFTHCPATRVVRSSNDSSNGSSSTTTTAWDVETPRGTITAEEVVHCTNAFAGHLLPQLAPHVTPNRAQAHLFVPPASLSGSGRLASTMSLRHSLHHFYSVMQRAADGLVVLGASRKSPNLSPAAWQGMFTTDDTGFSEEVVADAVGNFEACFPACARARLRHGEGLQHSWTGIIGMTTDSVPFVGRIDSLPGQYVCCGFNGHGMARIFNCAPGLVKIMTGSPWEATGLPECFEVTEERLRRLTKESLETVF